MTLPVWLWLLLWSRWTQNLPHPSRWVSPIQICFTYFSPTILPITWMRMSVLGYLVLWFHLHPVPSHLAGHQCLQIHTTQYHTVCLYKYLTTDQSCISSLHSFVIAGDFLICCLQVFLAKVLNHMVPSLSLGSIDSKWISRDQKQVRLIYGVCVCACLRVCTYIRVQIHEADV